MEPLINVRELENVMKDCLFREEELLADHKPPAGAVLVESITITFGFHPGRLEQHKDQIARWLHALPEAFQRQTGGGSSFLNACDYLNGEQWGEHSDMEALFALGIATGACKLLMPRDMWDVLPGGMPYYVVD